MDPDTSSTRPSAASELRRWRALVFSSSWLGYAGLYFCRKAFYAVKPAMKDDLGLGWSELGDFGLAYLIAYTAGQFTSAATGTRLGARRLILIGMAASITSNVVFGLSNTYWQIMVFMVVNGLAQATGWPSCVSVLARWTSRQERGLIMGLWGTCYQLGGVAATSWAVWWLDRLGWRSAFFAASCVLAGVWAYNFLFLRSAPEDAGLEPIPEDNLLDEKQQSAAAAASGAPGFWTASRVTTVALLGMFYLGVKFIRYTLWSWAPALLTTNFDVELANAGYLSTVFDLAGFAGVIVAGTLSDRVFAGRRASLSLIMIMGMMVGCVLLWVVGSSSLVLFVGLMGLIGFMLFGPDSLISGAGAADLGNKKAAIVAAGVINGLGSVGAVIQELLVSRSLDETGGASGPVLLMLIGASAVAATCLALVVVRNRLGISDV